MLTVFDLDGTLVDSRRDLADSANELVTRYGGTPLSEDAVGRMVGDGAPTLVRRALDAAGVAPRPEDAFEQYLGIYHRRMLDHTAPYDGIVEALAAAAGHGPLAVLTNKPEAATRRILEGLDLARWFAEVIGGDGPFARKPSPDGLRHLMAAGGAGAAATILVGDSRVDVETGRRAGVRLCVAAWGFGFAEMSRDELRADETVVDRPGDLVAVFEDLAAQLRKGSS